MRPQPPNHGGLEAHTPNDQIGPPPEGMERSWWPKTGLVLTHHAEDGCEGACPIHAPSDHHMTSWPLHWRPDRGIFERLCEHGVGHPDPDTIRHIQRTTGCDNGTHCCDGCC